MRSLHHQTRMRRALAVGTTLGIVAVALVAPTAQATDPTCSDVVSAWPESGSVTIASANDLYCVGEDSTTLDREYVLSADIDISPLSVAEDWRPIGSENSPFTGSLDGASHAITNLSLPLGGTSSVGDGQLRVGLFGAISGASLANITLTSPAVAGGGLVGALVGESFDSSISDITATSVVVTADLSDGRVGGLVGYMDDTDVTNVTVSGSVESLHAESTEAGGVVGRVNATPEDESIAPLTTITNADFSGSVRGPDSVGGVLGAGDTAPTNDVKWIALTDLTSSGSVSTNVTWTLDDWNWAFGGAIGAIFDTDMSEIHSTSSVTSAATETGGLIGSLADSTLEHASATGNVTVNLLDETIDEVWCDAGGLIGEAIRWERNSDAINLVMNDLSATGEVSCVGGDAIGGLIGYVTDADITNAHASGNVTATGEEASGVGGLAGYVYDSTFTDVSASGDVEGENDYVAGLIAGAYRSSEGDTTRSRDVIVTRASTTGSVQGRAYVSGVIADGGVYSSTLGHIQILSSSTSSPVSGLQSVGGVAAGGDGDFLLKDVVSTGAITGWMSADGTPPSADLGYYGGIVGYLSETGSIERAYTTSTITTDIETYAGDGGQISAYDSSAPTVGSIVGRSLGTLTGLSFTATSPSTLRLAGQLADASSANAAYRSVAELGQLTTYSSWNDPNTVIVQGSVASSSRTTQVWGMCPNVASGLPFLQWQQTDACSGASPTPGPSEGTGGGASSGGSTESPTVATTSTSSIEGMPETTARPAQSVAQSPLQGYRQPLQTMAVTSTVSLVSETTAAAVSPRTVLQRMSSTIGKAPFVIAKTSQPIKLEVGGFTPGATYTVKIKAKNGYVDLGTVKADAKGMLQLPVFSTAQPAHTTIAVVSESGTPAYLKVQTTRSNAKSTSAKATTGKPGGPSGSTKPAQSRR